MQMGLISSSIWIQLRWIFFFLLFLFFLWQEAWKLRNWNIYSWLATGRNNSDESSLKDVGDFTCEKEQNEETNKHREWESKVFMRSTQQMCIPALS